MHYSLVEVWELSERVSSGWLPRPLPVHGGAASAVCRFWSDADGHWPLPWLAVGPETPMCVDSDGGAAASAQFWQDAYDDAYY